jgi:hypothetical protein
MQRGKYTLFISNIHYHSKSIIEVTDLVTTTKTISNPERVTVYTCKSFLNFCRQSVWIVRHCLILPSLLFPTYEMRALKSPPGDRQSRQSFFINFPTISKESMTVPYIMTLPFPFRSFPIHYTIKHLIIRLHVA